MKQRKAAWIVLTVTVLLVVVTFALSVLLAKSSLNVKYRPPTEYDFVQHYVLNTDVYVDEATGQLYLYKPGMGTFRVWNIVEDPPEFIQAQIVQGEN